MRVIVNDRQQAIRRQFRDAHDAKVARRARRKARWEPSTTSVRTDPGPLRSSGSLGPPTTTTDHTTEGTTTMYAIHPIVSQQLVETRARELHRIAGHTRLHRDVINPRPLGRRRP
jgi:hypothetical protein